MKNNDIVKNSAVIKHRCGELVGVVEFDRLHCGLDNNTVWFVGVTADNMVVVAGIDGKQLPDYRHITQVVAY